MIENLCFLLGTQDPEMDTIEQLCEQNGLSYAYAKHGERRVSSRKMYKADNVDDLPHGAHVVSIECAIAGLRPHEHIDHHRPGDSGYDKGPENYWIGSSLGQFYHYTRLGVPSYEEQLIAAIDHCFQAAVDGQCPGIEPGDVIDMRIENVIASAHSSHLTEQRVKDDIKECLQVIARSPTIKIGSESMHEVNIEGDDYTYKYLCFHIAAALSSKPVLFCMKGFEFMRYHLCGRQRNSDAIVQCMNIWQEGGQMINVYGNPFRGYAGAYRLNA